MALDPDPFFAKARFGRVLEVSAIGTGLSGSSVYWSAPRPATYRDLATFANFMNLRRRRAGATPAQEQGPIEAENRATFICLRDYVRVVYGAVFLRLVGDLTTVAMASRTETPTLAECYGKMAAGSLDIQSSQGQALLGAAMLRQVEL